MQVHSIKGQIFRQVEICANIPDANIAAHHIFSSIRKFCFKITDFSVYKAAVNIRPDFRSVESLSHICA